MVLAYAPGLSVYIVFCTIKEKSIPARAGFVYNKLVRRRWATKDPNVANILWKYAVPACKVQIGKDLVASKVIQKKSKAVSSVTEYPCPEGIDYLPFQKAGIDFMLERDSVFCADDMGVGKTIEALGVLNTDTSLISILVVTKAVLKINWLREIQKWRARKMSVGIVWPNHTELPKTNIVVINYDLLDRFHLSGLRNRKWDCIILDEGHYLKNPKKKRTRAVFGYNDRKRHFVCLPLEARRKMVLTGTPMENRPKELFSLLHWLDPIAWPSWFRYAQRYCDPKFNGFGTTYKGASNVAELRARLRGTLMIRREFTEVFPELPPVRYQIIEIPVQSSTIKKLVTRELYDYNQFLQKGVSRKVAFAEMSALRHQLAVYKRPLIQSYLEGLREESPSRKLIVFGHHHDVLDGLHLSFPDSVLVRGGQDATDRQRSVDKFQNDIRCNMFLGSIAAAGEGLNLYASSLVIFGEFDWRPGKILQAIGRALRLGQKDRVLIQYLVLAGSLDFKLITTFVNKHIVNKEILGDKREII